jgi:uncharacterized protein with HEPN domain
MHPDSQPLLDMLEHIDLAAAFAGTSLPDFLHDRRSAYATVRCLEVVSDASRDLSNDLKSSHPHIAWSSIGRASGFFRQHYDLVRDDVVWSTVTKELPPLREVVVKELDKLKQ